MKLTKNYGLKKAGRRGFLQRAGLQRQRRRDRRGACRKARFARGGGAGHFAAFSAGGIADSGKAAADFLPAGTTPADIGAATAQAHSTLSAAQNAHANDAAKHFSAAEKAKLQKAYTTDDIVVSSAQPAAAEGRIWIRI